jgi:Fe-Mn family superoxide dismutase
MDASNPSADALLREHGHADGSPMTPAMALALQASFGSVERWRDGALAMQREAIAANDTDAVAVLGFVPAQGGLVNRWLPAAADAAPPLVPLLAWTARQPAVDQTGRDSPGGTTPADAFMRALPWARVYARYQQAVDAASAGFGVDAAALQARRTRLLDVRRKGVFGAAAVMIPGAVWRDPADVAEWAAALPRGEPVVVYCVYGHEVGRSTALRLRAAGLDARYLEGGIDGWAAAGLPLAAKPEADT